MNAWWQTLSMRSRVAVCASLAALLVASGVGGWWLLRPDPAVLFSELRDQDAAALAGELDKLKIPYSLADNGATLLVERSQVPAVRMKLMGREVPLHGTVGLELFNTTDFGMTEFAQKINFQRALQGELTRTILSFPEIRDVRVHLVLPDQGLFKQTSARAKAAITLAMRPGQILRAEQVAGIQRLVAAAVPALSPQEVTIVDQRGLPLSRPSEAEAEGSIGSTRLELKRETEQYLARKATMMLEQVFGSGQALASVDVTLNMDSVRLSTEDVIPAPDGKGSTGVLVRERENARDNGSGEGRVQDGHGSRGSSMQRDAEYQAGRRVEQVVSQPGAIRRIQVVAVVRDQVDEQRQRELERLLGAAVGVSVDRGDTVVVQALRAAPEPAPAASAGIKPSVASVPGESDWHLVGIAAAALAFLAASGWLGRRSTRGRATPALTHEERRAALQRVQTWMLEAATATPVAGERTGEPR